MSRPLHPVDLVSHTLHVVHHHRQHRCLVLIILDNQLPCLNMALIGVFRMLAPGNISVFLARTLSDDVNVELDRNG